MKDFKVIPFDIHNSLFDIRYSNVGSSGPNDDQGREILSAEGYGIIENPDGEDIYFHRNAVKDMAFNDLAEGDSVMYAEEMGEKDLHAIWVRRS